MCKQVTLALKHKDANKTRLLDNHTQVRKEANFFNTLIISGNWDWIQFFQALSATYVKKLIRYEPLTNFI